MSLCRNLVATDAGRKLLSKKFSPGASSELVKTGDLKLGFLARENSIR